MEELQNNKRKKQKYKKENKNKEGQWEYAKWWGQYTLWPTPGAGLSIKNFLVQAFLGWGYSFQNHAFKGPFQSLICINYDTWFIIMRTQHVFAIYGDKQ